MISHQFNEIIFNYKAYLFIFICFLGQTLAYRYWMRNLEGHFFRRFMRFIFIILNLGWFFTLWALYFNQNLLLLTWSWVGRPSVAWQAVYIIVILPLMAVSSMFCGFIKSLLHRGKKADDKFTFKEKRLDILKNAGIGCISAILLIFAYGVVKQGQAPSINHINLSYPDLPPQLEGFTIAHISDLHLGLWTNQQELANTFTAAAKVKPDMVVLTGDLIDRDPAYARLYFDAIKPLEKTPYGIWAILGNHDHYADPNKVAAIFKESDVINMMVNDQVNLTSLPLSIIGLDDQGVISSWIGDNKPLAKKKDPNVLDFNEVRGPAPRAGDFVIVLNHRPEGFNQVAQKGYHLYLTGHTHGGQYQVPYYSQANFAALFYKYSSGLYKQNNTYLNVSRGVAAVGIPFRLWAWPEIDLITLKKSTAPVP